MIPNKTTSSKTTTTKHQKPRVAFFRAYLYVLFPMLFRGPLLVIGKFVTIDGHIRKEYCKNVLYCLLLIFRDVIASASKLLKLIAVIHVVDGSQVHFDLLNETKSLLNYRQV